MPRGGIGDRRGTGTTANFQQVRLGREVGVAEGAIDQHLGIMGSGLIIGPGGGGIPLLALVQGNAGIGEH
jgi:hypothetical protein